MTSAALSKTPCDFYGVTVKVNDESLNDLLSSKMNAQLKGRESFPLEGTPSPAKRPRRGEGKGTGVRSLFPPTFGFDKLKCNPEKCPL
jgi:hypothetical protein